MTPRAKALLLLLVPFLSAEEVAPGVHYHERVVSRRQDGAGPFRFQVLEVDPRNPAVNILPVRALDRPAARETVSSMARRYGAVAGVNGGYFVTSGPQAGASTGVYQLDGQVISGGSGRSALIFCRESDYIERIEIDVVELGKSPVPARRSGCQPEDVVGAGPRLVTRGAVAVGAEGFRHTPVRHPRTAFAVTDRGTYLFVTLDGRQPGSIGMRLDELAAELIALGAVEAMNLDGGGSTTMVVRDTVRNSPSDGKERPVSDAILMFSEPGPGIVPRHERRRAVPRPLPDGRGSAGCRKPVTEPRA